MRSALPVRPRIISIILSCASFLVVTAARKSTGVKLTQSNDHSNISELLDNLLRGYDNSIRPDFGGPPATVEVDIMVRSMGPISEVDMTYSMDCYFRQSWVDRRLAFRGGKETLALSISMLARIWKPDTYFYNGKQSYLHTITSPNKFVRLYQDGRVLYSSRLTIKAGCPMNLEDFPMDTQRCPLQFGSFGYTTHDVVYKWNSARQVAIAEDMKLSQFDLVANPTANESNESILAHSTEYSMLLVYFHLQRHMGNFLIQVYGPCVLLVVLSWVSFWLNREATADRVSLGITTVLTMTFLGLEARTDLPKVSYPTALDFFVFLSFAFIFATIIQFAVVHYFTKYGSGEVYFSSDLGDSESSSGDEEEQPMVITIFPACSSGCSESAGFQAWHETTNSGSSRKESEEYERVSSSSSSPVGRKNETSVLPLRMVPRASLSTVRTSRGGATYVEWQQMAGGKSLTDRRPVAVPIKEQTRLSVSSTKKPRKRRKTPRYNSVSRIDRASRIVFPLFFLAINLFYWYAYLSRSKRMSHYNSNSNAA